MLFLRDMKCTECGDVHEIWVSYSQSVKGSKPPKEADDDCPVCEVETHHVEAVRGGLKSRWRWADWPSDASFYDGQIEALPPKAMTKDADGELVPINRSGTDTRVDSTTSANNKELRSERKDKIKFRRNQRHGKTPLHFNQKQG
jgi:hypothetical protein